MTMVLPNTVQIISYVQGKSENTYEIGLSNADVVLLHCDAVWTHRWITMFWRNILLHLPLGDSYSCEDGDGMILRNAGAYVLTSLNDVTTLMTKVVSSPRDSQT